MNRPAVAALVGLLVMSGAALHPAAGAAGAAEQGACRPSPQVLHASPAPVTGLSTAQVEAATAIVNAAARSHVPERGQTIAVMTALQASRLGRLAGRASDGSGTLGVFRQESGQASTASRPDPTASAEVFYRSLTKVQGWQNLPPTLAAHAAQHNLDPEVYARWWAKAVRVVDALTSGSGVAGLQNLAARAQAVSDCETATLRGRFEVNGGTRYVGPLQPTALDSRALDLAQHGGGDWHDRCQNFVAVLDGRAHSGYSTALDAWQTFEAEGVAHPVTSADGVSPPVGAWLYYRDSTNPAGHVVTYLGNGQIASTDVFALGRVGVGPASAITDGPWHMTYLGWAPPWGAT